MGGWLDGGVVGWLGGRSILLILWISPRVSLTI